MKEPALEVRGLSVGYERPDGRVNQVVSEVSLQLHAGSILGLVGESGCGKSTTALAAIGYPASGSRILKGSSILDGVDLLSLRVEQLRTIWGRRVAYLAQHTAASLNPSLTIGRQLGQPLETHMNLNGVPLRAREIELLKAVHLPDPEGALSRYPYQLSGGQQQRVMIAIALSCDPEVLIFDEPTTGLDVTTQAAISGLLRSLVGEQSLAALYVSHDLALLSTVADRLAVMYAGEIVEEGPVAEVCIKPRHPYTRALYAAVPSVRDRRAVRGILGSPPASVRLTKCSFAPRCPIVVDECVSAHVTLRRIDSERSVRCLRSESLRLQSTSVEVSTRHQPAGATDKIELREGVTLRVHDLWCAYRTQRSVVEAVRSVSFSLGRGETLGIVGESGSGKSTLLRAIVGLHIPSSGSILLNDQLLHPRAVKRPRHVRRELQIVFQNPDLSLNPRHTIDSILRRPIRLLRDDVPRAEEKRVIDALLEAVKLPRSVLGRHPFELSGGQKQRIALARAFAVRPSVLLCDEATSALDVSVQATIIDLIAELASTFSTAVLFVSHDLAVVRTIAGRALVMKDGVVCEEGHTEEMFVSPNDPYTKGLVTAIPELPVAHQVLLRSHS